MIQAIERRYLLSTDYPDAIKVEERDGEPTALIGISPPWESLSVDLGGFREKFSRSSFDKLLTESGYLKARYDVPFLFNHDPNYPTGRTSNGRMEIRKEDLGLAYRHLPLQTTHGRDLLLMVKDRTITGSSFAFTTHAKGETWVEDERGQITRTIHEATGLFDQSAVVYPAYPQSTAHARSIPLWREARGLLRPEGRERTETLGRAQTIAIDFDSTLVASPGLWRSLILDAHQRGDEIVVLSRSLDPGKVEADLAEIVDELKVRTVFIGEGSRRAAVAEAGITVDAWICPEEEGREATIRPASKAARVALEGARAAAAAAIARMTIATG